MKVLPDTSIWVEYLRRGDMGDAWHLDALLLTGEVVVCGPVVAELLAGTKRRDRDELWLSLRSLPWAELGHVEWRRVGQTAGDLRERGQTVPLTDVQIAVSATSMNAGLWTHDSDFQCIAAVLGDLQIYQPP